VNSGTVPVRDHRSAKLRLRLTLSDS